MTTVHVHIPICPKLHISVIILLLSNLATSTTILEDFKSPVPRQKNIKFISHLKEHEMITKTISVALQFYEEAELLGFL